MQEDNAYIRKSTPQIVPAEQEKESDEERLNVLKEYPVIAEAIERLTARVTFYKTNDSIPIEVLTDPEKFMHVVAGNKVAATNLEDEIKILEDLLDAYKPAR